MLRNYLLVALRTLNRQRGYAAINVIGLGLGITVCLLIGIFVRHELAYDRHHEHVERIVRVATQFPEVTMPVTASIVGPLLDREIPDVEASVRLFDLGTFESVAVRYEDRMFEEDRFFYADSTVFAVFTLPLLAGDPATALTRPRTVVLTEATARKYFDDKDPIGRTLLVSGLGFEVTGVLAPLPASSHVRFDFLASFNTLGWAQQEIWTSANFYTYLLLRDPAAFETVPVVMERLLDRARANDEVPSGYALHFEPLHAIHLEGSGRRTYVYLLSAIAALILLIACVNYMNLATAQATRRAKEVGVRKVTGAHRRELIGQFYGESALLVAVSLILAAALTALIMPTLHPLTGQALSFSLADPFVLGALLVTGAIVTLLAGSYPALLLSSFTPSRALKGSLRSGRGSTTFRRGLVTFQFAVSVFLLVGTAVIFSQLRYVQSTNLGFQGEQVIALPAGDPQTHQALPAVKRRLMEQPGVLSAAAIDRLPGSQPGGYSLEAEGFEIPEGMDYFPLYAVPTEPGVIETLGLELIAGSDFRLPDDYQSQPGRICYLVNEATLRVTGWTLEEAIGKRFTVSGDNRWGTVIGVFRDYHFLPLHEPVSPLALFVEPDQANTLLVRLAPEALPDALAQVEEVWREFVPHRPFTYTFLDEAFSAHYESERQVGRLFGGFALLAVVIACLGLLGLAAYAAERRTKEIGVRKVLGARARDIVTLLSREFVVLVGLGFVVAAPLAYVAMSRWLEGFAYRVELGAGVFLAAGAVVLLLALATVSGQALRAATADPVEALRSE